MWLRSQYGLDDGASVYSSLTTTTNQAPGSSQALSSRGPSSVADTASLSGHSHAQHQVQQYASHHHHHTQQHPHDHSHGFDHEDARFAAGFAAQASAAQELDDDLDGVLEDLKLDGGLVEHACR